MLCLLCLFLFFFFKQKTAYELRISDWSSDVCSSDLDGLVATHQKRFDHANIEFLLAEGSLVGPRTVEARGADGGTRRLVAERLFLDLGTRPALPDRKSVGEGKSVVVRVDTGGRRIL